MANLAVNAPRDSEDLTYNPRQPGLTNPAYGLYNNPDTYSTSTSNGDFAGEVGVNYGGRVRLVDPTTGETVFEGLGKEATAAAFNAAQAILNNKGMKAAWAVQIDDGKGGWSTAAMDLPDPEERNPMGMVADIALPIIASIIIPGMGVLVGPWGAAAKAAAGSIVSSLAQDRPGSEILKRALTTAVTAGIASAAPSVFGRIGDAVGSTTGAATGSTTGAVTGSAIGSVPGNVAEVVINGASGVGQAAAGIGGVAGAFTGGQGSNTIRGDGGGDQLVDEVVVTPSNPTVAGAAGGVGGAVPHDPSPTGSFNQYGVQPTTDSSTVNTQGDTDEVTVMAQSLAKQGVPIEEMAAKYGIPLGVATLAFNALGTGAGATVNGVPVDPVTTTASGATTASGGTLGGVTATGAEIAATGGTALVTTEAMLAAANAALAGGTLASWIAANPVQAAALAAKGLLPLVGALAGDGGSAGGGGNTTGTVQKSALFSGSLPAPKGIFANLTPRDMPQQDWNKYGEQGEQSFFNYAPQRASAGPTTVTPPPVAPKPPVLPANPGTGTTAPTTPATAPLTAAQNMAKYGNAPGVLDLKNLPTSVDNPYAGYATTKTPTTAGAVALPANSAARFVVQDAPTEAELAKQASRSAAMAAVPSDKDLSIKSTGTPPAPADPAKVAATAPTTPQRGYSQADMDRFANSPGILEGMKNINAMLARSDESVAYMTPSAPGQMSQAFKDDLGLKGPVADAPPGVDPFGYYVLTKPGNFMSPAEITSYNASVEASPEVLGTTKMAQINSPEWFAQHFDLTPAQAAAAAKGVPQFKRGGRASFAVQGPGTGRSDEVPALLSEGEFVVDAETVALLGDGSNKAGAQKLEAMRKDIRKHKGRALAAGRFSANAKAPLDYMRGGSSRGR
jgi:hypothetical protein